MTETTSDYWAFDDPDKMLTNLRDMIAFMEALYLVLEIPFPEPAQ